MSRVRPCGSSGVQRPPRPRVDLGNDCETPSPEYPLVRTALTAKTIGEPTVATVCASPALGVYCPSGGVVGVAPNGIRWCLFPFGATAPRAWGAGLPDTYGTIDPGLLTALCAQHIPGADECQAIAARSTTLSDNGIPVAICALPPPPVDQEIL